MALHKLIVRPLKSDWIVLLFFFFILKSLILILFTISCKTFSEIQPLGTCCFGCGKDWTIQPRQNYSTNLQVISSLWNLSAAILMNRSISCCHHWAELCGFKCQRMEISQCWKTTTTSLTRWVFYLLKDALIIKITFPFCFPVTLGNNIYEIYMYRQIYAAFSLHLSIFMWIPSLLKLIAIFWN